jgi:hypothetical protein
MKVIIIRIKLYKRLTAEKHLNLDSSIISILFTR